MNDLRSQIKVMLGIRGSSAPHTVLADLNEITCFATLCDPTSIADKCIDPILTHSNMAITKKVKEGFRAVFTELNTAGYLAAPDKGAFNQIASRLQTVIAATPKGKQAGGIKIVQGYNEAMFLVNQLGPNAVISESYFTNTAPLLINAVADAGAPAIAHALSSKGWRPNPADILIKIAPVAVGGAPSGPEIALGVSLKASYGKCAPTICNFGMRGAGWDIRSYAPKVLVAHQKGAPGRATKTKLLIAASQAVVNGIASNYAAPGAAQEFLEAILHCQSDNLPYLFVAAQGNTCYGINFARFKELILKSNPAITVKAQLNGAKIGQSLIFTIPSAGPVLEFSFRVKRTANTATDPSLKINVTMTPLTKNWLCDNFPIGAVLGQCSKSMTGGGITDMVKGGGGMVLRSGRQLPPFVSSQSITTALGKLAPAGQLCMIDDALDDEPVADAPPSSAGGAQRGSISGGRRRRRKRRTKRKKRTRRQKKQKTRRAHRRPSRRPRHRHRHRHQTHRK